MAKLNVNGNVCDVDVEDDTPLLWVIREHIGLTGTKYEGSVALGLSAALFGEATADKGRIVQSNFHDYRPVRMAEMPKVETVLVPTLDFWGGVGEPTICVVTPSVLNAIHAATGKPVRSLPLKNVKLV